MRVFAVVLLVGLLLCAPGAGATESCDCSGRALCVKGEATEGVGAALKLPVTLELRGGTNQQLSDELSRIAGKRIVVSPAKPDEPINLDVKSAPLWDVLEALSLSSTVQVEGEDFSKLQTVRKALASGEKISVCINAAPLARVIRELSGLSGKALRVTSGDEKALVTLSAEEITLDGILTRVLEQTGARIAVK
ncbi:MAG TPA: hypothetical protein VG148_10530 [Pyrinomonadaceae bacterium]|nr:hypothetical protein [Pyrinomonadaceae bacterium]